MCDHATLEELAECEECPHDYERNPKRAKNRRKNGRALCLSGQELEQEIDDLMLKFIRFWESKRWFAGLVLFLAPPIHSKLSISAESYGASTSDTLDDSVTHVVTYHKPELKLRGDKVLRSLGGSREQDLVSLGGWWHLDRRFIKVVYQDWIEDCVAAGKVLPRAVRWEAGDLGPITLAKDTTCSCKFDNLGFL
ncbi:hypothetical protein KC19_VG143700 [Ceratodon purpureus]|uniref:BRCT domain-containing protein n=1 Tax=Ceratodon purpureus TaxID=3225 RepID=A0A8T0HQG4_CERPU|nr:hypothetical protein KC19_VG143700 [Ceratodon purpureus]